MLAGQTCRGTLSLVSVQADLKVGWANMSRCTLSHVSVQADLSFG